MRRPKYGDRQPAPEMADVKQVVRDRDGGCTVCGISADDYLARTGKRLDVHRTKPGRRYAVDECVAVCALCHDRGVRSDTSDDEAYGCRLKGTLPIALLAAFDALAVVRGSKRNTELRNALSWYVRESGTAS